MEQTVPDLVPALPELWLAVAGMALLLFGVFNGNRLTGMVTWLTVGALAIAGVLVITGPEGTILTFNDLFVVDGFARMMKILVLIGAGLSLIMSLEYLEREQMWRFEYPVLILFATLGMMLMLSANDLMSLYVGLELQSLSLYVVAAFRRDDVRSSEAGLKYFVLGALSSGLLLYGASLVYGFAGTTNFAGLAEVISAQTEPNVGLIVGIVFVLAGLAFKISAVPFHMWTPDVYQGAPTPVTAFFAAAPKVAAIGLMVRVLVDPFGGMVDQWQQVVIAASVLSMALGAFAAIAQQNIKRLMAYSSIGNIGFALVGLSAGSEAGVESVIVYMAIYMVTTLGVFACILAMKVKDRMVEGIDDLKGLSKSHPTIAFALAMLMFSLAGIPPLAGFWGKFYVFVAAVDAGLAWLAVIAVLTSVVSAYYYLRIIKLMYFDDAVEPLDPMNSRAVGVVLLVSTLFILLFVLPISIPVSLTGVAAEAASTLF